MGEREPFNEVYRKALDKAGVSIAEAARRLGMVRATLQKYLRDNCYPETRFREMCEIARLLSDEPDAPPGERFPGLRGLDRVAAERRYKIEGWVREHRREPLVKKVQDDGETPHSRARPTLEDRFREMDQEQQGGLSILRKVANGGKDLFDRMGKFQWAVIFTSSVEPLVYRCYSETTDVPARAAEAIRRGMRLCVVIPTEEVIEGRYRKDFHFYNLHSHANFLRNFDAFRAWTLSRWSATDTPQKDPEDWFDRHVLQIESSDCCFHVPGWTFSLFGDSTPDRDMYHRAIFRTPAQASSTWQLHQPHPLYERRLSLAALKALNDAKKGLGDSAQHDRIIERCKPEAVESLISLLGEGHSEDVNEG